MCAVGDVADVRIVKVNKSYAYGIIEKLTLPSPDRIDIDCTSFKQCGGCAYRHISYEAELKIKCKQTFDCLERIGGFNFAEKPIIASPNEKMYRNKAQYPVAPDENGRCTAGFYSRRSHRITDCSMCMLQPSEFNDILNEVISFANNNGILPYNEKTGAGLLRHVYIRKAVATGEIMVCLVVNGKKLPCADKLVNSLSARFADIASIYLNINTKRSNVILGNECVKLYGKDFITDILCGVKIQISPLSFYQVNHDGAERLYGLVKEYAELSKSDFLLDLYCGAGTIGLSMASEVKKLVGVEVIPDAVKNAEANAKLNGFENCKFICADASQAAERFAKQGEKPDVIVLDPPRKGCDEVCLDAVVTMSPKRIVMVSCNPATLARDLKYLAQNGYEPTKACAVDMFPRTTHTECVVLMSRNEKYKP